MAADFINYQQWSFVGGYDQYHIVYIFRTVFFCSVVMGAILWFIEGYLMLQRSWEFFQRHLNQIRAEGIANENHIQESERSPFSDRLGMIVRLLTGLLEDLPVVMILYFSVVIPFCGVSTSHEWSSPITIATVVTSMLNSMWTMFVLYWDLFKCIKRPNDMNHTSISSNTNGKQVKRVALLIGRTFLCIMIFVIFTSILILSAMTIRIAYRSPILEQSVMVDPWSGSVKTDFSSAELNEAMFITMTYELPNWYHVSLYDNKNVNIANSASVNQIQNRLYIGQFNELEDLRDGTLLKAFPCRKVFPFLSKIDDSLFEWNNFQQVNITDFCNCELEFKLKYHPTNNHWNPFTNFKHEFFKYITVEWSFHIKNSETCPTGFQSLPVSFVLTDSVKQDIVNYTCSLCNGTDICSEALYGKFEEIQFGRSSNGATVEPEFYLTINDQKFPDSCIYKTVFNFTMTFCGRSWGDTYHVHASDCVNQSHPEFITYLEQQDFSVVFHESKCSMDRR